MTTTLTGGTTKAHRETGALRGSSRALTRRAWVPVIIGVGGIGLACIVVWSVLGWRRSAELASSVQTIIVEPRTFNLVLKEKGELKAAHSTDIKCEVEGRSTIISLIPEGTAVKAGDLLVELASDEIENRIQLEDLKEANAFTAFEAAKSELAIQRDKNASDIRKAELQIELAGLELDKYTKADWVQKLKDADIAIEQAEMGLERREQDYTAYKELYAKDYTTLTELEEAEFNFKKAEWDLEKARMAREVLEKYTHVADLKRRESDHEEAIKECERVKKNAEAERTKKEHTLEGKNKELTLVRDQLAKLRTQRDKCRIVSPTPGFVVYGGDQGHSWRRSSDDQIKEGATVHERQILMQLPDTSSMTIIVRIHEAKTDKLKLGQSVVATIEGIPGRRFTGSVTKIAAVADSQSGWLNPDLKEYETEITLDPTDAPLKPGVTAHAEILVRAIEEKLAVPVQAVYSKNGHRYVFRGTGDKAEPVEVELGGIGTEWAEVASGLSSGDSIFLAFSDEMKRSVPDTGWGGEGGSNAGRHRRSGRRGPAQQAAGNDGNRRGRGAEHEGSAGTGGAQRGEQSRGVSPHGGDSASKRRATADVPAKQVDHTKASTHAPAAGTQSGSGNVNRGAP